MAIPLRHTGPDPDEGPYQLRPRDPQIIGRGERHAANDHPVVLVACDQEERLIEYAIDRYTMEVKRQLDLLDQNLADRRYICGDEYTIADMAIYPWYGAVQKGLAYNAAEFLEAHTYKNLARYVAEVNERPAVQRGQMVNRPFGDKSKQLLERHDASDFELRTQDILDPDPAPDSEA